HPQRLSNLVFDSYSGALQRRQMKVPGSFRSLYSPVNGRSVPLCRITFCSSGLSGLYGSDMRQLSKEKVVSHGSFYFSDSHCATSPRLPMDEPLPRKRNRLGNFIAEISR